MNTSATVGPGGKSVWHHPRIKAYQKRMKTRPTRAERRFDDILDHSLKGIILPYHKEKHFKKSKYQRKTRKFLKQHVFENQLRRKAYIVDFYIPTIKLVFEVDGPSHKEQAEYDKTRTRYINTLGITVLRIGNKETLDFQACSTKVRALIVKHIESKPDPKPKRKPATKHNPGIEDKLKQEFFSNGGTVKKLPPGPKSVDLIRNKPRTAKGRIK